MTFRIVNSRLWMGQHLVMLKFGMIVHNCQEIISVPIWSMVLHLPQKSPSFVGKYTSTIEHLGYVLWKKNNIDIISLYFHKYIVLLYPYLGIISPILSNSALFLIVRYPIFNQTNQPTSPLCNFDQPAHRMSIRSTFHKLMAWTYPLKSHEHIPECTTYLYIHNYQIFRKKTNIQHIQNYPGT